MSDIFNIPIDLTGAEPLDPTAPPPTRRRAGRPKAVRRRNDAYPTLDDLTRAIIRRVAMYCPLPEAILEPTAGEGAFVRAARAEWGSATRIGAVDIDGDVREKCITAGANAFVHGDILEVPREVIAKFDVIVGNLPFKDAAAILAHLCGANPNASIFILLPVSFFGWTKGQGRGGGAARDAAFWKAVNLTYFAPIAPRPSFTGDGKTDRMEYGLFGFGERIASGLDGRHLDDAITWEKP